MSLSGGPQIRCFFFFFSLSTSTFILLSYLTFPILLPLEFCDFLMLRPLQLSSTNKRCRIKGAYAFLLWASLVAQMVKCLPAMRETRVRFRGWEDPLEKEMAIHSSTLAWKIPWTEEPDRLQSMGSQRVGHD